MIKSVNIDGKDCIIRSCGECPVASWEDDGLHCQYPVAPHKGFFGEPSEFPEDCPLGMVEDCCTCKYEATKDEWVEPCCQCMVSWDSETGKESTPTKWEVKE